MSAGAPLRPFDGITVWPAGAGALPRVTVGPARAAPDDPAIERAWARLCAANPRLFDGPILSLASFDPVRGEVTCVPESYKRLSVQDEVETGVVLVAVNGVITAGDASGREHVLLGRRSARTRMYGGLWELAPAGGIDPPAAEVAELSAQALIAQLARELDEEAGLSEPLVDVTAAGYYRDDRARSFNIVLRARLEAPLGSLVARAERHWDCDATRWLAIDDVAAFDREGAPGVIDATRALWRLLGWVR